ncbi:MAG TPA: hypothetical protein VEF34_14190, partial [Syntrophobacteraceae bacterium]|nr:hypothetical protein [Syntrophobacteraceae bacterium]
AHNDLETIMSDSPLGAFPKGVDDQYFQALQDLANAVHSKWLDGPYPFNDLAKADVEEFLALMKEVRRASNYANRCAPIDTSTKR